ncbi:MAG: hypothetical protein QNK05_16040 [Myxococcota bacterium]|nr:hypothetical protein [Myxococcota bacterium]
MTQALAFMALVAFVQVFFVREAFAYLDAGTGSFIFQAIVAALIGLSVTMRHYWARIKTMFRGRSSEAESTAASEKAAVGND